MKNLLVILVMSCLSLETFAINEDSLYLVQHYSKAEYQIPMRDGKKLYTIVYSPLNNSIKYPVLLNRTPYSIGPYGKEMNFWSHPGLSGSFLKEGFIFVYQDVRGRFMSEGEFRHMTPFSVNKTSPSEVDESTDAFDTMDWLIKNLKNHNGRIGMWGISYPGFYTAYAGIDSHPALKCISPQAPIGDWFFDDVHHHGAFFLNANMDFFASMDLPRHGLYKEWITPFEYNNDYDYDFYMGMEPLRKVKETYFGDSISFWNDIVNHPNYDEYWQSRNILLHYKNIKPAVLVVGGWFDAEDLYGTFHTYQSIEKNNPSTSNKIVVGPWYHGGWARSDGASLGNVSFGSPTAKFYRDSIELPFFIYYLKDKGRMDLAEATVFMTGKNVWKKYNTWPPREVKTDKLFLASQGKLTTIDNPDDLTSSDSYVSDPAKPIPYTETIDFGMTREYMTDDQRFAAARQDVMVYQTDYLSDDLIMAGPLTAHLKVATTGTDADWVVKIIDVYPPTMPNNPTTRQGMKMGGYQQMVRSEVIRGRFRNSYEKPEPFVPGKMEEVNIPLQDVLHCFQKGHKIMIQIQSSWFPLVDINPQKYVDNIYKAGKEDFIKATQTIFHNHNQPSFIEFGILNNDEK